MAIFKSENRKARRIGASIALALSVSLAVVACSGTATTEVAEGESALQAAMDRDATWVVTSSGPGVVKDGKSIDFTVIKISTVVAVARMQEQGWNVEARFIESNENVVQSLVQGDSDAVNLALPSVLAAVSGDVPLTVFAGGSKFGFTVVGNADINSPEDATGKRVAYQATISAGTLASQLWTLGTDAEPQFLTMPGSAARTEALIAGQLDAVAVSAGFDAEIEGQAPGRFKVVYDPLSQYPFLLDTVLAYNGDLDPQKQAFLEALLAEQIKVVQEFQADTSYLEEMLKEYDVTVYPLLDTLVSLMFDDIGVSAANVDKQIELMVETGQIDADAGLPTGADLIDTTIWDNISK